MDPYTLKTKKWLDTRFKMRVAGDIYFAHQPIYGLSKAGTYSEPRPVNRYIITHRIMQALAHLEFHSLLDLGGAEGYKAWVPERLFGARVVNSDLSEEACKRSAEIFHIPAVTLDVHRLPFKDGAFDVVLCSETLEHVTNLKQSISEVVRICDTAAIITVPHESIAVIKAIIRDNIPHGHIHHFDAASFDFMKTNNNKIMVEKMISPSLKKLFFHKFGKRGAAIELGIDRILCGLTGKYEGLLFVILKNPGRWREKPVKKISAYQIINLTVPFHKMEIPS